MEPLQMEISNDGTRYMVNADQFFFQTEHKQKYIFFVEHTAALALRVEVCLFLVKRKPFRRQTTRDALCIMLIRSPPMLLGHLRRV